MFYISKRFFFLLILYSSPLFLSLIALSLSSFFSFSLIYLPPCLYVFFSLPSHYFYLNFLPPFLSPYLSRHSFSFPSQLFYPLFSIFLLLSISLHSPPVSSFLSTPSTSFILPISFLSHSFSLPSLCSVLLFHLYLIPSLSPSFHYLPSSSSSNRR